MERNPQEISAGRATIPLLFLLSAISLEQGLVTNEKWYWALLFTLPLLFIAIIRSYNKTT